MNILIGFFNEIWLLLQEMAPYLLFGFLIAGVLHVLLPEDKISKHLSSNSFASVLKASLFGVPLPICSCGVIPVAAHLEKQGANKGPILSFLISTPTTGVDSILATYSLLGPLLTAMRPIAALINGIFTGVFANWLLKNEPGEEVAYSIPEVAEKSPKIPRMTVLQRIENVFRYAFGELLEDVAKWLVIGIVIGGIISYLIPQEFIEQYLANPLMAYPLMLLIGIPMYVCATGSIPIAASLILKGMSPGAGFIFLFAGPATNTATISFVGGKMGKKSLLLYLSTILVCSLLFGGLIDLIWNLSGQDVRLIGHHHQFLPQWLSFGSAIILTMLLLKSFWVKSRPGKVSGEGLLLNVADMNCEHCRRTIDASVRNLEGVQQVNIDLAKKQVEVLGNSSRDHIISAIEQAGYHITREKR